MGNALGCAGLGERLAAGARDGDAAEVRRLLDANPGLARCAAFGSLSSPLHLAAAKGHHEIAALLLENGADVNGRNIYGQTALMQACRFGHWEVVQTLLLFRCNVSKADSLSGRTALHVAAAGGHVRCARLLLAGAGSGRSKLVNRAASGGGGGVTALHLAALHGHADCVHLLVDERADVAARTLPCAAPPMASVGAGSAPLHYAAAGGEVKCCQILVSRGADRAAVNCNGWLPVDVARTWGCHWLEHVLSPKSLLPIPRFPPSAYLSSPLASVITLARDCGLALNMSSLPMDTMDGGADDGDACAVCLERPCNVAAEVCGHELCVKCALDLCSVIRSYDAPGIAGTIPCPLCRSGIASFRRRAAAAEAEPGANAGDRQASSSPHKKRSTESDQDGLPLVCAPPAVMSS
ncbi:probable E3 ubiquitin-protein ligase XBOS36 isoform X2 [Zea mays]|uniref:RING-type E3 ubiquitin transferase n=1 Tax=Zea mays TaxID=4577 RepID=A0A804QYD7_MAIZE|nr:probable E3 ubiquitin-protein ligase XBOS36 isoform X2 [Zea mays]|eukprot:XP_008659354.1 probable E3 ubiquitin-protein ligase XBOS36 isoform X3 [Zea mays]